MAALESRESLSAEEKSVVEEQLKRILRSSEFARADRMSRFLSYVVRERMEGRTEDLKERAIGIRVFDRAEEWDPKLDNIVRSEARRLRGKLAQYYENSPGGELVLIQMPKGAYSPEFAVLNSAVSSSAPPVDETPTSAAQPNRRWLWIPLAMTAMAAIFLLRSNDRDAAVEWPAPTPFANEIGIEVDPSVTLDGKRIAYAWDSNGDNFDIYVKHSESGPGVAPQRVVGSPYPDLHPSWSPNGSKLAFLRVTPGQALLMMRDLDRGTERVLRELRRRPSGWVDENSPYVDIGLSWAPDGLSLIVTDAVDESGYAIYRVFVDGTEARAILRSKREVADYFPRISPDGRRIAFARYTSHGVSDLYVCLADGSNLRRITDTGRSIHGLSWGPDGRNLYYTGWHQGSPRIWRISADGTGPAVHLPDSSGATQLSSAQSSGLLAYAVLTENWNIWRIPLKDPSQGPQRFIASSGRNHGPSFSPDGKWLAFFSDRSGGWRIWLADADGRNPRQISQFEAGFLGCITWSPDSRTIAFDARPGGNSNIYTFDVLGGTRPVPVDANQFEERMPNWSPDGRYLYYNSNRDGVVSVWRRRLSDGVMQKVGPDRSFKSMVALRPERLVFNISRGPIYESALDGSGSRMLPDSNATPDINWVLSGDTIYFTREEPNQQVAFYAVHKGKARLLRRTGALLVRNTSNLAVSPDGQWLLYAQRDHSSSDIVLRRIPRE